MLTAADLLALFAPALPLAVLIYALGARLARTPQRPYPELAQAATQLRPGKRTAYGAAVCFVVLPFFACVLARGAQAPDEVAPGVLWTLAALALLWGPTLGVLGLRTYVRHALAWDARGVYVRSRGGRGADFRWGQIASCHQTALGRWLRLRDGRRVRLWNDLGDLSAFDAELLRRAGVRMEVEVV